MRMQSRCTCVCVSVYVLIDPKHPLFHKISMSLQKHILRSISKYVFIYLSGCTSSTVHAAVLPAAMSPQVEVLRFSGWLCPALLRLVQRHCILVVDPICLIVEQ